MARPPAKVAIGGGLRSMGAPGEVRGRRPRGLHTDHLDAGLDRLGNQGSAGRPAAAAHGHDNYVDAGQSFEDLKGVGSDARDQQRLIAGGDKAQALAAFELGAVALAGLKVLAMEDHLGPVGTHGIHLDAVGVRGDDDHGAHAEELGSISDRLAVIARRGRHHAAAARLGRELRHEIDAAAHLEGADGLIVLVFDIDLGPQQFVEQRVMMQRGGRQVGADGALGLEYVRQSGRGEGRRCQLGHGEFSLR